MDKNEATRHEVSHDGYVQPKKTFGAKLRRSCARFWWLYLLAFAIIAVLGLALALIFSVANVYFRDFGKVTQTLTQFTTFSVPMIYPFSMVTERFDKLPWVADVYLLNPVAEAVLLIQRGFWWTTTTESYDEAFPADLWSRGFVMLGVCAALLVLAQWAFTRLEGRVPELLV